MDQNDGLYICKICIKNYSSYKSLWNHNNKYHNINNINVNTNVNINNCNNCNKCFSSRQVKSLHIKKYCKNIKNNDIEKLKLELQANKEEINKLKKKIDNSSNKTINNNNGTIINNNIKVSLGYENINDLTKQDHLKILNSGYMSLIKLIELLNLNPDLPQYNNILVTNLVDKFNSITLDDEELIKYYKDLYDEIILLIYNKT
jgi:hypothetical protein